MEGGGGGGGLLFRRTGSLIVPFRVKNLQFDKFVFHVRRGKETPT